MPRRRSSSLFAFRHITAAVIADFNVIMPAIGFIGFLPRQAEAAADSAAAGHAADTDWLQPLAYWRLALTPRRHAAPDS